MNFSSKLIAAILLSVVLAGCTLKRSPEVAARAKVEILNAEKSFAAMVKKEGIKAAFVFYAADDAVINRGGKLYQGKAAINKFYTDYPYANVSLDWQAEYVDASEDGDLGYTYGQYQFSAIDRTGKRVLNEGIFHTVWKKQADGSWRYVWD